MKDSTKKRLIIAGLAAVSVLLIFGISRVLYKEPVQELPKESKPTEEVELMVDTEETGQVQKETESTEETKELIIEKQRMAWRAESRKSSKRLKKRKMKSRRSRLP